MPTEWNRLVRPDPSVDFLCADGMFITCKPCLAVLIGTHGSRNQRNNRLVSGFPGLGGQDRSKMATFQPDHLGIACCTYIASKLAQSSLNLFFSLLSLNDSLGAESPIHLSLPSFLVPFKMLCSIDDLPPYCRLDSTRLARPIFVRDCASCVFCLIFYPVKFLSMTAFHCFTLSFS